MSEVIVIGIICYTLYKICTARGMDEKTLQSRIVDICSMSAKQTVKDVQEELYRYTDLRHQSIQENNPEIEKEAFEKLKEYINNKDKEITKEIEEFKKSKDLT